MRAPYYFCCGWHWRSIFCLVDVMTKCHFKRICALHDKVITGSFKEDEVQQWTSHLKDWNKK